MSLIFRHSRICNYFAYFCCSFSNKCSCLKRVFTAAHATRFSLCTNSCTQNSKFLNFVRAALRAGPLFQSHIVPNKLVSHFLYTLNISLSSGTKFIKIWLFKICLFCARKQGHYSYLKLFQLSFFGLYFIVQTFFYRLY